MSLEISHSKFGEVTLLSLKGSLVGETAKDLLLDTVKVRMAAGETKMILSLADVNYADSVGIGALLRVYGLINNDGGSVKLLHLTKRLHDVLQLARLTPVFETFDDLQEAISSFQGGAKGDASESGNTR